MKFLMLSFLLLTACASTNPAFVRDGNQVWEATCNGLARSMTDCHKQAAKKCDGSYSEVGTDGTNSFVPMNGGYAPVTKRSLLFVCKDS